MTKTRSSRLTNAYKKYQSRRTNKHTLLAFFRAFMPEIIFRTTKLEGERVTRKMVARITKS